MYTCYLFADKFDDENCLSIRLDDTGNVVDSLEVRSLDEFRLLQNDARTIVVISSQLVSIHVVEIPLLSESKARPGIAYALEEKLADPVTHLHFAFDKIHYLGGKYLVVVIDKNYMFEIQNRLDNLQIEYNEITCDWFALNQGEACVIANRYLVNDVNFRGALDLDLFQIYLDSQQDFSHIIMFNDNPPLPHSEKFTKVDSDAYVWLAMKLFNQSHINLCQGEFVHNTNSDVSRKYLKLSVLLGCVWLVGLLLSKVISLSILSHQLNIYDKKIAVVYKKFFPDAKQVITPKFRISQILQKNQAGFNSSFWQLLAKFSNVIKGAGGNHGDIKIEQINMQNSTLEINIICRDFEVLENLESGLKQQRISVRKSGVLTQNNMVVSTLELSL